MKVKVTIVTEDKSRCLQVEQGTNLLRLLNKYNIEISSPCGGSRSCGKCRVRVLEGKAAITEAERELLSAQELADGYRLACCIEIAADLKIEIAEEGQIQVLTEGMELRMDFNPWLRVFNLEQDGMGERDKDNRNVPGYLDFLYKSTIAEDIDYRSLQQLPEYMEEEKVSLLGYSNKIIGVSSDPITDVYGLAVDIGTTTVAIYLLNLLNGEEVDVASFHNPQKIHGADVISRINYSQKSRENLRELQGLLLDKLNQKISDLVSKNGLKKEALYLITVVANTSMSHIFAGVNPQSLARAPYRPVFTGGLEISPEAIGLKINPAGIIQLLPAVSAYIGSDIIADLLVADFSSEKWKLLIDIGTNGEIVLGNKERLLSCSAAAGPAFEGAKITHGTAGIPGAISAFEIMGDNSLSYQTIASKAPLGICGSGLVDIIAEMLEHNILTGTGLFNEDLDRRLLERFTSYKGIKSFTIVDEDRSSINSPILLSQKDVRELQLAKGAIAAGINILLKEAGIAAEQLDTIYLAGGFGSFINAESARRIGLLPENTEAKIIKLGNGAGLGARAYLLDKTHEDRVKKIIEKIEYLELSNRSDFQEEFMNSMEFQEGENV